MLSFDRIKKKIIMTAAFIIFVSVLTLSFLFIENRYKNLEAEYPEQKVSARNVSSRLDKSNLNYTAVKTYNTFKVYYYLDVEQGEYQTVTVKGKPNQYFTIKVMGKSGELKNKNLCPKYTDNEGFVSWKWKIGQRTSPASYPITISNDEEPVTFKFNVYKRSSSN